MIGSDESTKIGKVKAHLKDKGALTLWDAYQLYGVSRLSNIIYLLRGDGMDIKTEEISGKDRNDNPCTYANYTFKEKEEELIS
jgi:hypothetical protein